MRAIVVLYLLHAAFGENVTPEKHYRWQEPTEDYSTLDVCFMDQASCGCCLIQRQLQRMEMFFNMSLEGMEVELTQAKTSLNNMRSDRSVFSVALNNDNRINCYGPFSDENIIVYKHVFINLGGGYDVDTGTFTVPRTGVYSLAVTIYSVTGTERSLAAAASLLVNGRRVARLLEQSKKDPEDSATVVMPLELKAGDKVAVSIQQGSFICDHNHHYNTFTGFLLYATD